MSTLTNKEEAYCQAQAQGKGPSAAYRASRDCSKMSAATINANAKKLERKPAIKARIEELRQRGESSRESSAAAPNKFAAANGLTNNENSGGHGGEDTPSGGGPRIGHLDSLGGVVREMAAVYREVRTGKTEPDIGCKLVYILKEIRAALEAHVLERLEQRLEAIEGGRHGDAERRRAIPPPQTH
jgi:hypothetical protein